MGQLSISNIVNVSVALVQTGANAYNTSNLALFSDEQPNLETFGDLGYAIYLSPTQVGIDFGTSSKTYQMANAVFSQQPNILTGGGSLIVILMNVSIQTLTFNGVAASGTFEITSANGTTAAINWDDTTAQIQTKVRAVSGQSEWIVTGTIAGELLTIQTAGSYGPQTAFTISANSLMTSVPASITITVASSQAGQSIGEAISASQGLVSYFGLMCDNSLDVIGQTDLLAAAAIIQPLNLIGFFVSHTAADIESDGMLTLLASGDYSQTRGLYYGDSNDVDDIVWMAGYASAGLSTNFNGSNTTATMNLRQIVGSQPDLSLTQTLLNDAIAAGADSYPSLQGVPAIISTGANQYFDQIYGTRWFAGALQIAGFNYLALAGTKIPQTESGMDGLKGAYRAICQQAVTNQFVAPGTWTSPIPFGDPTKFVANIGQFGYYIYSIPIAQQLASARAARQAPLVSIAIKLAGAIQSSEILVYVNP